jgi:hypothetical protein
MIRFKNLRSLQEVAQNAVTKDEKFHDELGNTVPSEAKQIGTLPNGHDVYHHQKGQVDQNYYVVDPKTKKVNIALSTEKRRNQKAEKIGFLSGNKDSLGAEHLYKHLVLNHGKILTSGDQSSGARRVWDKASKHPKINVHAYDPKSDEALPLDPKDDENYVRSSDIDKLRNDWKASPDGISKSYEKDYDDLMRQKQIMAVMHKK